MSAHDNPRYDKPGNESIRAEMVSKPRPVLLRLDEVTAGGLMNVLNAHTSADGWNLLGCDIYTALADAGVSEKRIRESVAATHSGEAS